MAQGVIGPINPNLQVPEIRKPEIQSGEKGGTGFGDILKEAISTVNELQKQSDQEIQKLN